MARREIRVSTSRQGRSIKCRLARLPSASALIAASLLAPLSSTACDACRDTDAGQWSKLKAAKVDECADGDVTPTWIGAARGLEGPLNFRPRWRLATSGTLRLLGREACGGM